MWVAGKTVRSLVNTCHPERFGGEFLQRGTTAQMSCLQPLQLQVVATVEVVSSMSTNGHRMSFQLSLYDAAQKILETCGMLVDDFCYILGNYLHMPIGKVWIYRLLFVCVFFVTLYGYGFFCRG